MNPRRVHELMTQRFPAFLPAEHEWKNVVTTALPGESLMEKLLREHISEPEAIVEVTRKIGALLPLSEAAVFALSHIGESQIRIANRDFNAFVVVAQNGVATGWRLPPGSGAATRAAP